MEARPQQLLARGGSEARPRVPAQLVAKLLRAAAPRFGDHGGGGHRGDVAAAAAAAAALLLVRGFLLVGRHLGCCLAAEEGAVRRLRC